MKDITVTNKITGDCILGNNLGDIEKKKIEAIETFGEKKKSCTIPIEVKKRK